ncbi:MAG: hypothetical protein JXR76_26535 [Deltaproteobacteria bacterium]|nr:hypothetical protein [Deltaproteobacteria bacterium]
MEIRLNDNFVKPLENSYQPPLSDIVLPPKQFRMSKVWFGYGVFIAMLTGLYVLWGIANPEMPIGDTATSMWLACVIVGIYGVFKFAISQKIKPRFVRFWRWFPYGYSLGIA